MMNHFFQYLKESPMFHFSLHAKELFHSNFLAWLGSDEELRPVFKAVMMGLGIDKAFIESWGDNFEVLREKDNIDLVVKAPDGVRNAKLSDAKEQIVHGKWYVVIENKVKSVPTDEQLKRYAKKCDEKTLKLLLVISGDSRELDNGWRRVNYTQVVGALKESVDKVTDPYKKAIISDYIGMVESLVGIIESQNISINSKYLLQPSKELDELRISDLVDKWRAAQIACMIFEKTGLNCTAGYTNKQSLIEAYTECNGVTVGVQIQGSQYRHCIIGDIRETNIVDTSKGFLKETRKEFREMMRSLYPNVFNDKSVRGEGNKTYCAYGNKTDNTIFWYQYVVIKDDATIGQIMECLASDMKMIPEYLNHEKTLNE